MRRLAATVLLALAVAVLVGCLGVGSDDDGLEPTATATAPATTTPTPTPSPTGPPGPAAAATPTPTATPDPTPTRVAGSIDGDPFSLEDFESALPSPGIKLSDEFEPVCPGASAQPVVFTGPDGASVEKHAVWVLWVYTDHHAFEADWSVGEDFRVRPLLGGCEPPNGFVYWHENLVLWFAGFYGSDVAPGSLPATADEIREHTVVSTFLELTWQ
ncbi:MAG: hypothetical protein OXH97_04875 [Chloroflexota bacterium]|nr:hypothetical protein [Chloroflexota bacterium]